MGHGRVRVAARCAPLRSEYGSWTMSPVIPGRSTWQPSFEEIFDLSLDLLCICGLDGYFRRVNPAFEQAFGYSTEELLSRPVLDVVHPDDRASVGDALGQLADGGEIAGLETRVVRADGATLWLEWSARAAPSEGVFYGSARDVTDHKLAEQRLRHAQQAVERSRDELRAHVEEQAALRRVATLVAQGRSQMEILHAVAAELDQLFNPDVAVLTRYDSDGDGTVLASSGAIAAEMPIGMRIPLDGKSVSQAVLRTGRPARVERHPDAAGPWSSHLLKLGISTSVGAPIVVEGRIWGGMATAWKQLSPLAADDAERRLPSFAELVVTAIANADSRAELQVRSEEQAALRRVATLVARGVSPSELLDAVAEEVSRLLDADNTKVLRYERESAATILASYGEQIVGPPIGSRVQLDGDSVTARVSSTGRPARMEYFERVTGTIASTARELGVRSTVGAPIIVEDQLWGVVVASWTHEEPPAAAAEARLAQFTELVATAVANAESRAALTASRARVVATADATRRRIERDLHDGAQQRLVSLALEVRAAQAAVPPELSELRAELSDVAERLTGVLDDLREIAHGIHPALLSQDGLRSALKTLARRSTVPVELALPPEVELPEPVEVAAYYVISEALTNAAKHANASVVQVGVEVHADALHVRVSDNGVGGAEPGRGSGLLGLKDRAEALGGRIALESAPGRGTSLQVLLPLAGHEDSAGRRAATVRHAR
jgi:PAS domain S-box-containing protein